MKRNGRTVLRGIAATALIGVLGVTATACGDDSADSSGGAAPQTGLTAALRTAPAADAGTTLSYWDVKAARDLVAKDKELYGGLDGYGIPELAQSRHESVPLRQSHGFDEKDVVTALQIGSDRWRLAGRFDPDAMAGALKKLGYTEGTTDGGKLLTSKEAGQVAVSPTVRSTSVSPDAPPPAFAAPGKSVADDPAYQAVARCVGDDAYLATFFGKGNESQTRDVTLYAIGARAQADGSSRERLCALTVDPAAARRTADRFNAVTVPGERFAGATVDTGDGDAPLVTMEWANGPKLRPGDQLRTLQLPKLLQAER
ncbi:hypothetical protein AB0G79_12335 [Streptomyces sp. NPDC020807]|uniref:hypothetical protein n=1 Tax=Streptomyces sp. NPDC020807 TaxID=3155119 RepID=UPI0033E3A83E